jgi:ATP phosphoribosyltransferase
VADYRIVESLGATEGAPASGAAELIVDITTTGATLEANALKVLSDGVLLRSQANLVASLKADWSKDALGLARTMLDRIAAETLGRTTREIAVAASSDDMAKLRDLVTAQSADILDGPGLRLRIAKDKAGDLAAKLVAAGAKDVTVSEQSYVFTQHAPLFQTLKARLDHR